MVKELIEYNFSAPDFTTFTMSIKEGTLTIGNAEVEITTDMTRDTLQRLKDLCTLGLSEIN